MTGSRILRGLITSRFEALAREGFQGSWRSWWRVRGERIDTVGFETHASEPGQFFVELGVDFAFLDRPGDFFEKPSPPVPWAAEFRTRLKPSGARDHGFPYGTCRAEAERSFADLQSLFQSVGLDFFRRFEPLPEALRRFSPRAVTAADMTDVPTAGGRARTCLVFARIWDHYGDGALSRAFATRGLKYAKPGTALEAELRRMGGKRLLFF